MRIKAFTFGCFFATIAGLAFTSKAQSADTSWYTHATVSCSDPFNLQNTYMNGAWFQKYHDIHYIHVSQSLGFVELQKSQYDDIRAAHPLIFESFTLNSQNARLLQGILLAESTNSVVPVTADILSLFLGYAQAPGKYVAEGFLKFLLARDAAAKVSATALAAVMAGGGHVDRLLTIGTDANHHSYLLETFDYAVDVGSEHRHYATISCTYAIKIIYEEFVTQVPKNNKIFRMATGTQWNRIDVDTNKVEQVVFETGRDDDFIYLNENDPNNRINDAYRISLNGGPWQIKNEDGSWGTLTSRMLAR